MFRYIPIFNTINIRSRKMTYAMWIDDLCILNKWHLINEYTMDFWQKTRIFRHTL